MSTRKFRLTATHEVEVDEADYAADDHPLAVEQANGPMLLAEAIQDGHVMVEVEELESDNGD